MFKVFIEFNFLRITERHKTLDENLLAKEVLTEKKEKKCTFRKTVSNLWNIDLLIEF